MQKITPLFLIGIEGNDLHVEFHSKFQVVAFYILLWRRSRLLFAFLDIQINFFFTNILNSTWVIGNYALSQKISYMTPLGFAFLIVNRPLGTL